MYRTTGITRSVGTWDDNVHTGDQSVWTSYYPRSDPKPASELGPLGVAAPAPGRRRVDTISIRKAY